MTQTDERRISERVPAKFKVSYIHQGDYLISHSRDLSVEGMFLHTQKPGTVGEETTLEFKLNKDTVLQVSGKIVWVNREKDNEDAGMAIKFIKLSGIAKKSVLQHIKKIAVITD